MKDKFLVRHPQSEEEIGGIRELLAACFPRVPTSYFDLRYFNSTWYEKSLSFVIVRKGKAASYAQLVPQKLVWRNRIIDGLGIGAVCTHAESRGEGMASAIFLALHNQYNERPLFLFAKNPALYRKVGYEMLPRSKILLLESDLDALTTVAKGTVELVSTTRDIASLLQIHHDTISRAYGAAVRDAQTWNNQLLYFKEDPNLFRASFVDGVLRAYIRGTRVGTDVRVVEYATHEDFSAEYIALLKSIFADKSVHKVWVPSTMLLAYGAQNGIKSENEVAFMVKGCNDFQWHLPEGSEPLYFEADAF